MTRQCSSCGSFFSTDNSKAQYCSQKCYHNVRRTRPSPIKGRRRSLSTEIKQGQHLSPDTEFKPEPKVTVPCSHCGVELQRTAWRLRRNRLQFCNKTCFDVYQTGRRTVEALCAACSRSFLVGGRGNRTKGARYCSNECASRARIRTGEVSNKVSDVHAAYLAALIDGEGSIMLPQKRSGCSVRLTIANTFRPVLEWVVDVLGVGAIVTKHHKNPKWKTGHTYQINSHAAHSVIQQIRPYLIIKAKQADLAIATYEGLNDPNRKSEKAWQVEAYMQMKELNRRGPKQ
jgi:hypothetical protein